MAQSFQHLTLAACACAVALSLAYTSATSQDKQLPPLGEEPPPTPPDVQSVEGDLGRQEPAPSPSPSGTPKPGPEESGVPPPPATRLETALGLASRDAEASRSLAAALARNPCDKSLIAQAEVQLLADITAGNLLFELGEFAFPMGFFTLGAISDLAEAQAALARELTRARAANCVDEVMIDRPAGQFYVSSDGTIWCSYGDGAGRYVAFTPTDENGVPLAFAPPSKPADTPQLAERTPTTPGLPPAHAPSSTPGTPPPPTDTPPPTASAPPTNTPTTTDAPPVTPPTADTPPQIPDTVFVKASQVVLEGGRTGSELQNQTVKLVFAKPDLPGTGASKTAQDTGFDRDPAQCTTGANGQCKIVVHPEDRPLYGLASSGAKPSHYRLDLNLLKHSGAVAETTGKAKPDLKDATPAGSNIAASEFKVGNRKFTRLGIDQPHGRSDNFAALSRALGAAAETDYCRTKKPGPPLGLEPASLAALNHELPEAAAKLDGLLRAGRAVR